MLMMTIALFKYYCFVLEWFSSSQRKRTTFRYATTGFPSKSSLRNEDRNSILMTFNTQIWVVLLICCAAWESGLNQSEALSRPEY